MSQVIVPGSPPLPPTPQLLRTVTRLGLPTVAENMLNSFIVLVDMLMLARLENNVLFIAATAITGISWWRLVNISGCTQVGASAYVARRWGEGDYEAAGRATAHALCLTMSVGTVVAVAG